jgi:drug/metabolite transporter (DMT)-like permease
LAECLLLLVAIVWGTSYGVTKEALVYISVLAFISIRFLLTSILMLPFLVRDIMKGSVKGWPRAILTGVILLAIFLFEVFGIFYTSAANAAFLISLFVIFTPLLKWLLDRQYPGHHIILLAAACVIGVYLLTWQPSTRFSFNLGDGCILIAAFLRACMVLYTRKIMKLTNLSMASLTVIQSSVVGIGALVLLFMNQPNTGINWTDSPHFWLSMSYLIIFCTLIAFFAQNYALKHTNANRVSLLMGSEPFFGALFAILWLGESFNFIQIIGACIILACIFYATSNSAVAKSVT